MDQDGRDGSGSTSRGADAKGDSVADVVAPDAVIRVAAAVVVDDLGRTLVVRKRGTSSFMQPGGKIEAGETAAEALQRELREELRVVPTSVRPLGRFRAPAANEPGHVVDAELFLVEVEGHPRLGAEIEEMAWLDPRLPGDDLDLAPLTRDVVLDYLRSGDRALALGHPRRPGENRRAEVLSGLATALIELQDDHPLRVAIDGITASGKTTLADELSDEVIRQGRPVVRVRMDDFHHPREHRYRQGKDSARGYYDDAYDFDSLYRELLKPLGPEGDRRFRRRIIDLGSDDPINAPVEIAPPGSIVIADGSFMQRRHRNHWDCVVFVDTSFPEALRRGVERDHGLLGGTAAAEERYARRYHAAARIYIDDVDPSHAADFVIDNDDLEAPQLHRNWDLDVRRRGR